MGKVTHAVSLNTEDGSEQIWDELFSGKEGNFSEWIRLKLAEEKQKRGDKSYIHKQISEAEGQVEFWKKQLQKAEQIQIAKEQTNVKHNHKTREQLEREFEGLIRSIGSALEFRFIGEVPERQIWEDLALEWNEIMPSAKPTIDDFLESKGYIKKVNIRRELTI